MKEYTTTVHQLPLIKTCSFNNRNHQVIDLIMRVLIHPHLDLLYPFPYSGKCQ